MDSEAPSKLPDEEVPMIAMSSDENKSKDDLKTSNSDSDSSDNNSPKLKRELTLIDGASMIIGIIVGSGIFVSPKGVLLYAGSVGLSCAVWALSGALSFIGALCYAELGTMIPKSGGDYAYIKHAYGPLLSFLYLWSSLLVIMPAGNAIIALTFANYILEPFYPECEPPQDAVRLIAAMLICFLTAVNCSNVKLAAKVTEIVSITKVFALVMIIIAGFIHLAKGHTDNLSWDALAADTTSSPGKIALSFYSGLFSYAGWNYLNFVTEEIQEPNKNLPRAIYISLPLVTVIYLMANIAYFAVLSSTEILSSSAVAVSFGNKMFGVMRWIIPFFVACSTFGAVNSGIFASSRLFFVGARSGHMPRSMALINLKHLTPIPCLILLGMITLSLLITSDVFILINFTSFVESLFIMISVSAVLYLRWKEPDLERPIKVNIIFPVLFFLICGFLVLMPIFEEPHVVGIGLAIIVSGVPVYLFFIKLRHRLTVLNKIANIFDRTMQKFFFALPDLEHKED